MIEDWGTAFGRYFGETLRTSKYVIENHLALAVVGAEAGYFAGLYSRINAAIKRYSYPRASVPMTIPSDAWCELASCGCRCILHAEVVESLSGTDTMRTRDIYHQ